MNNHEMLIFTIFHYFHGFHDFHDFNDFRIFWCDLDMSWNLAAGCVSPKVSRQRVPYAGRAGAVIWQRAACCRAYGGIDEVADALPGAGGRGG